MVKGDFIERITKGIVTISEELTQITSLLKSKEYEARCIDREGALAISFLRKTFEACLSEIEY